MATLAEKYLVYLHELDDLDEAGPNRRQQQYRAKKRAQRQEQQQKTGIAGKNKVIAGHMSQRGQESRAEAEALRRRERIERARARQAAIARRKQQQGRASFGHKGTEVSPEDVSRAQAHREAARKQNIGSQAHDIEQGWADRLSRPPSSTSTSHWGQDYDDEIVTPSSRYSGPQYDYSQTTAARGVKNFPGKAKEAAKVGKERYKATDFSRRRQLGKAITSKISPRVWGVFRRKVPKAALREMDMIIKRSNDYFDNEIKKAATPEEKDKIRAIKQEAEKAIKAKLAYEEEDLNQWRRREIDDIKNDTKRDSRTYRAGRKEARKVARGAAAREVIGVVGRAYDRYKQVKTANTKDAIARRDAERQKRELDKVSLERDVQKHRDAYIDDIRSKIDSAIRKQTPEEIFQESLKVIKRYRGSHTGGVPPTPDERRANTKKVARKRTKKRKENEGHTPAGGDRSKSSKPGVSPEKYTPKTRARKKPETKRPSNYKTRERERNRKRMAKRKTGTRVNMGDQSEAVGQRPLPTKTMIQRNISHQSSRPKPKPVMKPMTRPMSPTNERGGYGDHYEKEKTSLGKKLKKAAGAVARATGADELKRVPSNVHQNVKHQFVHKFLLR
jgi:hypothetical protein